MQQDKYTMFMNRLHKVHAHRKKMARKQGVTCYRLYDLDLPEFPFAIDLYEDHVCAAEYQRNHKLTMDEYESWLTMSRSCIAEVLQLPVGNVHLKQRQVINERHQQYNRLSHTNNRMVAHENGHRFYVNLDDYLDTGLFLDHRPTRQRVKAASKGKKVLNLFAYTGSFSVYAAAGGAMHVTTVDLSNTYIDWARENFDLNGLDTRLHTFIATDVMGWLPSCPAQRYDLIVCDPPTFSNSKKMAGTFDVQRDHPALINQCLRLLAPEGLLVFSTNNRRFRLYDDHIITRKIRDITRQTRDFDFEGKLNRMCYELQPG
jgi:23S rRNA (cytosine1962-C5)-methyltransferase